MTTNAIHGLLYSRIGYDTRGPKRAIYRTPETADLPADTTFTVRDAGGRPVFIGPVQYWGEIWNSHWWVVDFSTLGDAGRYEIELSAVATRGAVEIADDLLWRNTWRTVALEQFAARQQRVPDGLGWQDCGSVAHGATKTLREVTSHAAAIIGLADVLEYRGDELDAADRAAVVAHIRNGCTYLAACQDLAEKMVLGGVIHELDRFPHVVPGEVPKCATALARAARVDPAHAPEWRERASRCLQWFRDRRTVLRESVYPRALGAPPDFVPPDDPMTCDWLMAAGAAWELALAGLDEWRPVAARWMENVLARQVGPEQAEGGYYGHFRTFDGHPFTEKAWSHHQFGFNCGAVYPHFLLPLIAMIDAQAFPDRDRRWRRALEDFAYHYFLPACRANPFGLLPNGYFTGVGLIWFCGLGHGMNAAYGWAAVLGREFARFFRDREFEDVAVGNLQWIAGLNAGLTKESLAGSYHFRAEVPEGVAVPCSMIHRIGEFTAGSWIDIPGSICNGFDVDEQFKLNTEPSRAADQPRMFTDEDWITHAGAWLSAVARGFASGLKYTDFVGSRTLARRASDPAR